MYVYPISRILCGLIISGININTYGHLARILWIKKEPDCGSQAQKFWLLKSSFQVDRLTPIS